jgi:hypothetical protein
MATILQNITPKSLDLSKLGRPGKGGFGFRRSFIQGGVLQQNSQVDLPIRAA